MADESSRRSVGDDPIPHPWLVELTFGAAGVVLAGYAARLEAGELAEAFDQAASTLVERALVER